MNRWLAINARKSSTPIEVVPLGLAEASWDYQSARSRIFNFAPSLKEYLRQYRRRQQTSGAAAATCGRQMISEPAFDTAMVETSRAEAQTVVAQMARLQTYQKLLASGFSLTSQQAKLDPLVGDEEKFCNLRARLAIKEHILARTDGDDGMVPRHANCWRAVHHIGSLNEAQTLRVRIGGVL